MNRDDLLKKCVDRGVADEGSVEAVSHLFYMYLLTALQKGQRVEVPNFGTFGTRVVGVKRLRRMPFFEVEKDLAERVNERYRDLKYLMVGRYELMPADAEQEYQGREAPHDAVVDQVGKELVIDTHRDVTIEEYERTLALNQATTEAKEKQTMPKLNLKETGLEDETRPLEPEQAEPPVAAAPEPPREKKGPSPVLQVVIALALLATITFALNYFGVIHLWGKKAPKVAETVLPPAEVTPPVAQGPSGQAPSQVPAPTPTPTPVPGPAQGSTPPSVTPGTTPPATPKGQQPAVKPVEKPGVKPVEPSAAKPVVPAPVQVTPRSSVPPSTPGGEYTVQVSSWLTMSKANEQVTKLNAAGLDAFISKATVTGETRYRVRVGRYATMRDAEAAAARLSDMLENGIWVAREKAQ
jgi:cell division protein FtsN